MKKILMTLSVFAAFAAVSTITSCTKTCDAGYSGSDCKTEVRAQFYGNYNVSGTATTNAGSTPIQNLLVNVATSSQGVTDISFTWTLGGTQYSLIGTLQSDNTSVVFASQTNNTLTYTGTGIFTTSTLTLNLTEVDPSTNTSTSVTLTGPKQ